MDKYNKFCEQIYNVSTLKEAESISYNVVNAVQHDFEDKTSTLYKNLEKMYRERVSNDYSVIVDNERILYFQCPACNKISKVIDKQFNTGLTCECGLTQKVVLAYYLDIVLGENLVLRTGIYLEKAEDKVKALNKFMDNPELYFEKLNQIPLDIYIRYEVELMFYTKKHKGLRVARLTVNEPEENVRSHIYQRDRYTSIGINPDVYDPIGLSQKIINKYNNENNTEFSELKFVIDDIYNKTIKTPKKKRGEFKVPKEIEEAILLDDTFSGRYYLYIDEDIKLHLLESKRFNDTEDYVAKARITKNNDSPVALTQSKEDISKILSKSKYKYSGLDLIINKLFKKNKANIGPQGVEEIKTYLKAFDENNKIETILKHPLFQSLPRLRLNELADLNLQDGKKPYQILGVSPAGFKAIELLLTYDMFSYYSEYAMIKQVIAYDQLLQAKGKTISPDTMNLIGAMFDNQFLQVFGDMYSLLESYNIDERQVLDYIIRLYKYNYDSPSRIFSTWVDYLNMANLVGYNLNNPILLFPEDINVAHGQALSLYQKIKTDIDESKIKEVLSQAATKYEYTGEAYSIIAPSSAADIVEEGNVLRHCVKSYVDRVITRNTNILFLRRNNDITKPFYTIEIKGGQVVQVRGYSNKVATPDINRFISEFKKERNVL